MILEQFRNSELKLLERRLIATEQIFPSHDQKSSVAFLLVGGGYRSQLFAGKSLTRDIKFAPFDLINCQGA